MATKTIKSETISFTVPETLKMELGAIPETGYYDSTSEFLRDAMRTILAARKDLRIAIASVLYKEGKISLGKAVEVADVNYEEMKKILVDKGIKIRRGASTKKEMEKELTHLGS
ncbi:MAG: UPF0175 family protein [Candidatus Woesearchaeota archaeon]|nr:UPF0175 family protein [Candidatus Woesearchaeota archaeon]